MTVPPFVSDTLERAGKSFVGGAIATFGVGDGFNAFHADWGNALGLGLGAAIFSVAASVLSYKFGNSGTASLTTAVQPSTARGAGPQLPGVADHAA